MKNVRIIRIPSKDNYSGCTFYIHEERDNMVFVESLNIGFSEHPEFSHNIEGLEKHLIKLINEGFSVIPDNNEKERKRMTDIIEENFCSLPFC